MIIGPMWKQFRQPPTPILAKSMTPRYAIKWGAVWRKNPWNRGTFTENAVHEPTFMAFELQLLWHTNPNFDMPCEPFLLGVGVVFSTGPNFIHAHPPHPWKDPPRGGGCIKRGGRINFLPRGASKYTPPPPSPGKCLLARNGGRGGGI